MLWQWKVKSFLEVYNFVYGGVKVLLIAIKCGWFSGRLELASNDPFTPPNIWSNDLGDPIDREIIQQGIRYIFNLTTGKVLDKYNLKRINADVPKCKNLTIDSFEYWDCLIQYNTRPENHQTGTCKMGPFSDPMAVVNPELKVHGVERLRVADESIMPQVNSIFSVIITRF